MKNAVVNPTIAMRFDGETAGDAETELPDTQQLALPKVAILVASCNLSAWDSHDTKFSIQYLDTMRT